MWLGVLLALAVWLIGCQAAPPAPTMATRLSGEPQSVSDKLRAQSESVEDLSAYVGARSTAAIPPHLHQRHALLAERQRLTRAGDWPGVARMNSALALEAFSRAARLTARWLDHRDPATGLFPTTLGRTGRFWRYQDTASDLFPHLALATKLLVPERYPEIMATLAAERALSPGLPKDIALDTGAQVDKLSGEKRMLGAVEYAKDGLLPLVEMVGGSPWLPRMREVMDEVIANARVRTPRGPIPADTTEVNGSALQALARLYWLSRDVRYLEMGNRISAAYLDDALPRTRHLPVERWDFIAGRPAGEGRLFLGDHGNEIVAGLVEWHRVELLTTAAGAEQHRASIRKMLDGLLAKGRNENGLWYSLIDVPSGKVRDDALTDNWGYLAQAYLNWVDLEGTTPHRGPAPDDSSPERFEQSVKTTLASISAVKFHPWEEGKMDGYADTVEGALYALRYAYVGEAADWVDEQMPILYGFQQQDGRVTDENIDGNFIRTTLLYALWLTQGVRLEPWNDQVALGAARDGDCLQLHLHASVPWSGRLMFDAVRHQKNVGLSTDYPRLNQWPEWFSVGATQVYSFLNEHGQETSILGDELTTGIPLNIVPEREYQLHLCPQ